MIGFFEHQYLTYKKDHLSNLIALARVDGHLHTDEEKMLYKLGEKYGLKDWQIAALIGHAREDASRIPERHDERMNQLYDLVMMIYADGRIEDGEVTFCEELMARFGFKKGVVSWMIDMFDKGKPPTPDLWEELKAIAAEKFVES